MIFLCPVDESNLEACSNLERQEEQCQFTNSPVWSLLQAAYTSIHAHCQCYAIQNDVVVVGMVRPDFSLHDDCYMFTNLMIDKKCKRRHYATEAVQRIFEVFRNDNQFDTVKIHVAEKNLNAIALYRNLGFRFCGKSKDDLFDVFEYKL